MANSSQLVTPSITAPAANRREIAVPVYGGRKPLRIRDPAVVSTPRTHSTSFTAIGIPTRGPRSPRAIRRSASSACFSQSSGVKRRKAFTRWSRRSICSACAVTSSAAEKDRRRSRRAASLIVSSVSFVLLMVRPARARPRSRLVLYRRHSEETVDRRGRVGQRLRLAEAGTRYILSQCVGDLAHLRGRRDRVGVELLQPVDVREDAAQLLGIELLVAGLEAKTREHGDMADLITRKRHWAKCPAPEVRSVFAAPAAGAKETTSTRGSASLRCV